MKPFTAFVACLLLTFATLAFGQGPDNQPATSPVAYVYVSSPSSTSYGLINAYSANSSGQLTPVSGSPFPAYVSYMALNGAWLFGTDGTYIYSFSIASDGALSQTSSINATSYNPYQSGGPGTLFLDHTGATLYDGDTYAYGTGDSAYQAFSIDQNTGQLNFLQLTPDGGENAGTVMSFTASNVYTYSSGYYHDSPDIFGYKRNADQTLTALSISPKIPAAPKGQYDPYLAAADPNNHLAIALTPYDSYTQTGPTQLAVYTQTSNGNLVTNSTSSNMPATAVTQVIDYWMSPSGKLLAVGGVGGLQVFHFNGANPITKYTGLLTKDEINQMFWDNHNHLYALSPKAGKLHVFTVTPTTHGEAPGSPYTIANPQNVIVLPK